MGHRRHLACSQQLLEHRRLRKSPQRSCVSARLPDHPEATEQQTQLASLGIPLCGPCHRAIASAMAVTDFANLDISLSLLSVHIMNHCSRKKVALLINLCQTFSEVNWRRSPSFVIRSKTLELLSVFFEPLGQKSDCRSCASMAKRDKATTYRHLQALEETGLIEQNPADKAISSWACDITDWRRHAKPLFHEN